MSWALLKKLQKKMLLRRSRKENTAKKMEEDILEWLNLAEQRWFSFGERYRLYAYSKSHPAFLGKWQYTKRFTKLILNVPVMSK